MDAAVLRPAAMAYEKATPKPDPQRPAQFLANLGEPMVFINDILQLKIAKGANTVVRFATNSTFGVGGLMDPATKAGIKHHDNNFGVTLARYGVPPGPYLFLPRARPLHRARSGGDGREFAGEPVDLREVQRRRGCSTPPRPWSPGWKNGLRPIQTCRPSTRWAPTARHHALALSAEPPR